MYYIKKFKDTIEHDSSYLTFDIWSPGIYYTEEDGTVTYAKENSHKVPYWVECLSENAIWTCNEDIYYRTDSTKWTLLPAGERLTPNKGERVYFKHFGPTSDGENRTFSIDHNNNLCNVGGDISSLHIGSELMPHAFENFYASARVVDASELILPYTELTEYCFAQLFKDLSYGYLSKAPKLPAIKLAPYCYSEMFLGCKKMQTAPTLPATTLADSCYRSMFYGCNNLTTAPELPVTTLANNCYYYMFRGCTNLTTAPELPATTLADHCYCSMFNGCTALTAAPELPATTLADSCYRNMFYNCTSLTTAPELPVTTLADSCYRSMFYGCNKLSYIKMLATDISANNCLSDWVNGVASNGTFVKNSAMTTLPTGTSGIPSGWTVVNDGEE